MKTPTVKLSRRKLLIQGSLALGSMGLGLGLPAATFASRKTTVKVGVLAPSHCALPMINADLTGSYREHGLEVEVVFARTMPEIAKGIFSGELHFGQLMVPMTIAAHLGIGPFAGTHQPLVSPMWAGTNGGAMVVRKDSDIRIPSQLKGKTIGVHSRLMFHYLITMELLERYRLKANEDVRLKVIDMNDLISTLQSGEIDAFVNPEPLSSAAVDKGIARDFLLTKDLWYRHPCCNLTALRSFYEKEPEIFRSFATATMKSALQLNHTDEREERLKTIWEQSPPYQELPLKAIQKAFTPGRTDFEPFPYQSSIKVMIKLLQKSGLYPPAKTAEETAAEIFLSGYAREILHSLGQLRIPDSDNREETVAGKVYG